MLIKRKDGSAGRARLQGIAAGLASGVLDRRTFLRRSGLTVGAGAALGLMPLGSVRKAQAGPKMIGAPIELKKNICTHCSVGCTVIGEVQNGVWVGQEPAWDSPLNRGSHCAKGASVRELVHGDRRLKYPMKLVNGEWQRLSWDQAINEIGDKMLEIRAKSGADSVYLLGSAKFSNEGGYLFRKFAAFWGTNSIDHQARICHSTTVAGVANTWGYGAMTNSYNDIRNSKTIVFMGSNAAEAHPVSLQHILTGKEINRANVFVLDPRFTRTAAHATEYVRFRSGTDIAVIWGMLHHIFNNGWEDKEFIAQRVYGMDQIRAEVAKWTPEEVERVTGIPGDQLKKVAETFAKQKPSAFVWCMGGTQHTVGTANVRAYCNLLLATGNVGSFGNGANIFRGHCNVQGLVIMGHGGNTVPRMTEMVKGLEKLELLVVADPHPTTFAAISERKNGTYLLPACTQFETSGSRTASNRSLQWGEQIVKPIFESKDDYEIIYRLSAKLGFAEPMFKNIKVENKHPSSEDLLREINRGGFSTGYSGQSPERLKAHMKNQGKFDLVTLRAKADEPEIGGDYYGLPWPCWGTPQIRHPGTHTLYNTNLHAKDGGGTFRARFGVGYEEKQPDGSVKNVNLLAEGSYSKGSELTDGYPEFTYGVLKKLGWDKDLTADELATINKIGGNNPDGVGWAVDLSGGIIRVTLGNGV